MAFETVVTVVLVFIAAKLVPELFEAAGLLFMMAIAAVWVAVLAFFMIEYAGAPGIDPALGALAALTLFGGLWAYGRGRGG